MESIFVTIPVGIILCVIGILNMKGNISSLHSYHRNNIKEEDIKPFGKLVGLGTVLCGISVIVFSAFLGAAILIGNELFTTIGTALMIVIMGVGIVISLHAIKKYNGNIFG